MREQLRYNKALSLVRGLPVDFALFWSILLLFVIFHSNQSSFTGSFFKVRERLLSKLSNHSYIEISLKNGLVD